MTLAAPTGVKLTFGNTEGEVVIDGSIGAGGDCLALYLSTTSAEIGSLAGTCQSGGTVSASAGVFRYATVRTKSATDESSNIDGKPFQPYELVCPGYLINGFHHEGGTSSRVWAFGRVVATKDDVGTHYAALYSDDWFDTFSVAADWPELPGGLESSWSGCFTDSRGYVYLSTRWSLLVSRDDGVSWEELPFELDYGSSIQYPGWHFSEDTSTAYGTVRVAEYAGTTLGGTGYSVQKVWYSSDATRSTWGSVTASPAGASYKHIHCYQVNPYDTDIHLMSLGDPGYWSGATWVNDYSLDDSDLFVSTDGGSTWGTGIFNSATYTENGPCTVSFLGDGTALITSDDATGRRWYNLGASNDWTASSLSELFTADDVDTELSSPATPFSGVGVYNSTSEVYGGSTGNSSVFGGLFRYNLTSDVCEWALIDRRDYTGVTSAFHLQPKFISVGPGNVIPESAHYVFSHAFGGIRIPRSASLGLLAVADSDHIALTWTDDATGEDGWYVERRVAG